MCLIEAPRCVYETGPFPEFLGRDRCRHGEDEQNHQERAAQEADRQVRHPPHGAEGTLIKNPDISPEERVAAQLKLAKLPRDSNPVRVVNRCLVTGRPRGNLRKFGLCRITFREKALKGELTGVVKASW